MKTFKFFFIAILSLTIITACEKSTDETLNEDLTQIQDDNGILNDNSRGQRSIPFKADFYTKRNYDNDGDGFCTEEPYLAFNYQVGEGTGTHLGRFTTTMSFCGAGFDYKNGEGVFIAANGDELYFWVPSPGVVGHVIPYVHPVYEAQFQDPFTFNGGTGRFEGATGSGMTNSYVDLFDDDGNFISEHRTDHEWTGTLILP